MDILESTKLILKTLLDDAEKCGYGHPVPSLVIAELEAIIAHLTTEKGDIHFINCKGEHVICTTQNQLEEPLNHGYPDVEWVKWWRTFSGEELRDSMDAKHARRGTTNDIKAWISQHRKLSLPTVHETQELAFVFMSDIGGSPVIMDSNTEAEPFVVLSQEWRLWWRKLTVENFNSTNAMHALRCKDQACDIRTFIAKHRTLVHHNLKAVV